MTSPKVLIAGIGNVFLSDDGFGCAVAARLLGMALPEGTKVIDYGIRGMHLAYDLLDGYDALIIIDALPRGGAPGDVVVLEIGAEDLGAGDFDAHGMQPTAVLASLGNLGGELPLTYVVGCEPAHLGDGMELTPPVEAAVSRAVDAVQELLTAELGNEWKPPARSKEFQS